MIGRRLVRGAEPSSRSDVYSVALSNRLEDWGIDWSFAYAHIDAKDTRSMTSSASAFDLSAATPLVRALTISRWLP